MTKSSYTPRGKVRTLVRRRCWYKSFSRLSIAAHEYFACLRSKLVCAHLSLRQLLNAAFLDLTDNLQVWLKQDLSLDLIEIFLEGIKVFIPVLIITFTTISAAASTFESRKQQLKIHTVNWAYRDVLDVFRCHDNCCHFKLENFFVSSRKGN